MAGTPCHLYRFQGPPSVVVCTQVWPTDVKDGILMAGGIKAMPQGRRGRHAQVHIIYEPTEMYGNVPGPLIA